MCTYVHVCESVCVSVCVLGVEVELLETGELGTPTRSLSQPD